MKAYTPLSVLLLLFVMADVSAAATVTLAGGEVLKGEIIRRNSHQVVIMMEHGVYNAPLSKVKSIEDESGTQSFQQSINEQDFPPGEALFIN